jgi:hypothetical protein
MVASEHPACGSSAAKRTVFQFPNGGDTVADAKRNVTKMLEEASAGAEQRLKKFHSGGLHPPAWQLFD